MEHVQGQYLQIYQAFEALRTGESSTEEFLEFVEETIDRLEAKGAEIFEVLDTPGYREGSPQECEAGEAGVMDYQEGLLDMLEAGDHGGLLAALRRIKQGNDLINKAMRLNRDAYEELDIEFIL